MELKLYLRILLKHWWIILAALIITLIPTLFFVQRQPIVYQTEATFVIRPRASLGVTDADVVKVLDTLSRRVEINTTFAEVANSSLIKQRAIDRLNLTTQEKQGLKVDSKVIAGTNILNINVQGPDPNIVRDFADAISQETLTYVSNLYDVFEMEPLDTAHLPTKPVSSNRIITLALGGAMGLFLGIGLVFFTEYLKEPIKVDSQVNIIDLETSAYNQSYLMLRLRQELSRARNNNYALSLALIKVYHRGLMNGMAQQVSAEKTLRLIITALGPNMRDEDILAHMGQGMFALLLPDVSSEAAKDVLNFLRTQIGLVPLDRVNSNQGATLYCSIGVAAFNQRQKTADEMLAEAVQALQEADTAVYGKVQLFTPVDNYPQPANPSLAIGQLSPEVSR
jgi:diguanylate cyclase (GGDEF)-like protein